MSLSHPGLSKPLSTPTNQAPPAQTGPTPSNYETSSRRPAQISQSVSYTTPRKIQGSRKQHRTQRRPGLEGRSATALDDYDMVAEERAMRNPSGRRGQTSITHLLNYTVPNSHGDHSSFARSYRRNPTWGPGSGHHSLDKARYVHANYRFVVSPETTYRSQAADPDVHIDWNNVQQVIASAQSQQASCPICLSEPVAPRMAKCGHIFCLPCLIRFMQSVSTSDEAKSSKGGRWKRCPICEDTIYLYDVRPVRFYAGQESPLPRPGDDVVLRLMTRTAASTLALPREGGFEMPNSLPDDVPWHSAANVLDYARIMKGSKGYMEEQFDEEISALEEQQRLDETLFGQDGEWTQKAIKAVLTAKEKVNDQEVDVKLFEKHVGTTATGASDPEFHFYSSPPHLYLSPLDIRILKTKFGSFSSFPSTLLPRVEHISTGHVVDDALRKRARYLGHLPKGCVISYLECDWTDIIPEDILTAFATDIQRRRKVNHDKSAQEDRERLQAERLEAAALRTAAGPLRSSDSFHFEAEPTHIDLSDFQPLNAEPAGTSPPEDRPGFSPLADVSTSPSNQRTVWGTRALAGVSQDENDWATDEVDDGWLKNEDVFGPSDLQTQLQAWQAFETDANIVASTDVAEAGGSSTNGVSSKGGGKKKKKQQKITLMSTGGRRGM